MLTKLNNNGAIKKTVMKSYIALICISNFISVSTIVIQEETQELIDGGEKKIVKMFAFNVYLVQTEVQT